MSVHSYERLKALFIEAMGLKEEERQEFLRQLRVKETSLAQELESLLAASEHSVALPGPQHFSIDLSSVAVPQRVGPYRILEVLGEGGMGVVYRAEQDHPQRQVALKVVRRSLATPEMLRRFSREADLLGRLQHPGIAQIFAAGTADDGSGPQPLIAMELVDGEPITTAARRLDVDVQLELLASVCDAVEHAHQNGVIHRDLKPANVLVTADGQPKVLDFGVAHDALGEETATLRTKAGEILGTLAYMSPEQAAGGARSIDSRSDVYSLGVVAYSVLTGALPFDTDDCSIAEALRRTREEDARPLRSVQPQLSEDVETVVLKALSKEKERRYPSASQMGEDLRRCRRREPITARPPSVFYVLCKLGERHRTLATAVVLVAVGLLATTIFAVEMAQRQRQAALAESTARSEAQAQRDEALAARDAARAVEDFLVTTVTSVRPRAQGRDVTLRELLGPMAISTARLFGDQPRIHGRLLDVIGTTLHSLGRADEGEPHLLRSIELLKQELGPRHPDVLAARTDLLAVHLAQGKTQILDGELDQLIPTLRLELGNEHPTTLGAMQLRGMVRRYQGEYDEAAALLGATLATYQRIDAADPRALSSVWYDFASTLIEADRRKDARQELGRYLAYTTETFGAEDYDALLATEALGKCLMRLKVWLEAERLLTEVIPKLRALCGDDHPVTISAILSLSGMYQEQVRLSLAEPLLVEAIERQKRVFGEDHPDRLGALHDLGVLYAGQRRHEKAEETFLDLINKIEGREDLDWLHAVALSKYGAVLFHMHLLEEAEGILLESYDLLVEQFGKFNVRTRIATINLAELYEEAGNHEQARYWRALDDELQSYLNR